MPAHVAVLVGVVAAYLVGAIPFGLLLARRFASVDVRDHGSRNIGATNVLRTAGRGLGLATLALDAAKGALPVWLAREVFEQSTAVVALVGGAAVLGHIFSVYLGFRGGKGVATSLGVFACVVPFAAVFACVAFLVIFAIARIASVASLGAMLVLVLAVLAHERDAALVGMTVAIAVLVTIRHRENIRRLVRREERGV